MRHPTLKERASWSRSETVGFHLHTLALHIDPQQGKLVSLAEAIEVDERTLTRWKKQGYVPWHQVKRLRKRYGNALVPDDLCPVEYRTTG